MFWEIFLSYGENKSPVQNLQDNNTGISLWFGGENQHQLVSGREGKIPLKAPFLLGHDSFR